jgi:hypothetical protein
MTYRGPYINPDVSAEYRRADDTAFEENRRTGNVLARAPTHDEIAARLGVPVYMSAEETAVVNALMDERTRCGMRPQSEPERTHGDHSWRLARVHTP